MAAGGRNAQKEKAGGPFDGPTRELRRYSWWYVVNSLDVRTLGLVASVKKAGFESRLTPAMWREDNIDELCLSSMN